MVQPEPWLRGTHREAPAVQRAVLHALELADEDVHRWCGHLNDQQLNARPFGLAPIAFHIRHTARSIDRLLTYAEGKTLTEQQLALLRSELAPDAIRKALFSELASSLNTAKQRVRAFAQCDLEQPRAVGKKQLPTTLAGLLVHIADHTSRHVGQAVTTSKIVSEGENKG